jgi:HlyD family secretion protein
MKPRHWVTLVVVVIAGALLVGIMLRLRAGEEDDSSSAGTDPTADSVRAAVQSTAAEAAFASEIAVPVQGAVIRRDTFVVWIDAEGRAAALRSAPLYAEVEGSVLEVPVREGQRVAAGALLARIDPVPYQLTVRRRQAEVDRAQAEFENLTLFDEEIEDPALREGRERQARIRSGLSAAEADLEEAEYELAKTQIRAPFTGRLANLAIVQGSRLRTGDSVATVIDLSRIDVEADVLETELPYVQQGREVRVTFPAIPDQSFTGRVVTINPLVSAESNSARVTVRLSNPEARMVPGMFGKLRIAGRLLADRMFVPRDAIVERSGSGRRREVIFVFDPNEAGSDRGSAKWKYVTTGIESGGFIEVEPETEQDRFEPGQIVLVEGHATLIHDARVQIENHAELGADR